jgi:amino acid adenylation domain-containing protein/non-ribosomal peptide synthase protein (TIGR01720 family)
VESHGLRLSYRQLEQQATQMAARLRDRGVGSGDLVGVSLERTAWLPVALLAVLKLGAAYISWETAEPDPFAGLARRGRVKLLIVERSTEARVATVEVPQARMEELRGDEARPSAGEWSEGSHVIAVPEQLACVLHTAGVTGRPKQVEIAHGSLVNLLLALRDEPGFGPEDVLLACSPASTVRSVAELWLPLVAGGRVVIAPTPAARDGVLVARLIAKYPITVLPGTPAVWESLVAGGWEGNQRLKAWTSGEPLREPLAARLLSLCGEAWNLYGTAETGGYCLVSRLLPGSAVSLGCAIPGVTIRIADDALQPVPVGVTGELMVAGDGLAVGYHGSSDSADRFVMDESFAGRAIRWFRTGDYARHTLGGRMEYVGRTGSGVMLGGFRIQLDMIEEILLRHPAIRQAVVIARERVPGKRTLMAYVVPKGDACDEVRLRAFLRPRLPDYMIPARFVVLDHLPLTVTGCVDRGNLPEPADPGMPGEFPRQSTAAFAAPRTATEIALANIWVQVLGTKRLGIHDNFFDLGGQSMLAMRAVMLAGRNGVLLGPRSIFQHPTIAELAEAVDDAQADLTASGSIEAPTGPVPLTPAQIRFLRERENFDPHRWNFSILMEADRLSPDAIRGSLEVLMEHHDALRLRLVDQGGEWNQHIEESAGHVSFETHDLAVLPAEAQRERLEAVCAELQSSLNLSQGPVLRVAHFRCAPVQADRLFFTLHHFVMDVLSWGIFWEDFESVYSQILEGRVPRLPAKTTSFRHWSLRLRELAESELVRKTIPVWLGLPWTTVASLPVDFAGGPQSNTNDCAESCELLLSAPDSRRILRPCGDARTEDIILMGLARALSQWSGSTAALIDVLGHGRGIVEDANLSRTVGFMLCYQPMLVCFERGHDTAAPLHAVLRQIRRLPEGFTFDLLRLFSSVPSVRDAFGKLPRAEVLFNFTGEELEAVDEPGFFRRSGDACGSDYSPRNGRYYPLAVSGAIVGSRLRFRLVYSRNLHRRDSMERLLRAFHKCLMAVVSVESEATMEVVGCAEGGLLSESRK